MTTRTQPGAGTPGAAVTTGNATKGDQLDFIGPLQGAGSALTYSPAHPAHGNPTSLGFHYGTGQSSIYAGWKASIAPTTQAYAYAYLWMPAWPERDTRLFVLRQGGANLAGGLLVTSAGILTLFNFGGSPIATIATPVPRNQLVRVEAQLTNIASIYGDWTARLFTSPEATTTTDTVTVTHATTAVATVDEIRFGVDSPINLSAAWDLWISDLAYSDTAMPPPPPPAGPWVRVNVLGIGTGSRRIDPVTIV